MGLRWPCHRVKVTIGSEEQEFFDQMVKWSGWSENEGGPGGEQKCGSNSRGWRKISNSLNFLVFPRPL